MPIAVQCGCGKSVRVRDDLAGKHVKCPSCGVLLEVPGGEAAPATAATPSAPVPTAPPPPPPPPPPDEPAQAPPPPVAGPGGGGFLGGVKAAVQATVEAGKEEAKRQARRASIALELTEKKKELDEVYARLGEKVLEDDGLRATVGLPEVLEQLARVDEEIRQAEAEAAELRRRLE